MGHQGSGYVSLKYLKSPSEVFVELGVGLGRVLVFTSLQYLTGARATRNGKSGVAVEMVDSIKASTD
jgi:hypothetical protein